MSEIVSESIVLQYELRASPARVFTSLTEEVGAWWTHAFRKGAKVRLEPCVGGRFYEEWTGAAGALYATVMYLEPDRKLRLAGPMGMDGAVVSTMEFTLEPAGSATRLTLTHDIMGMVTSETPERYREGWKALLDQALRAHVERR
jgi:uncharacterized protein YndB with AHSA1/START domain